MGRADRWRKVRLDFSITLSFPLISPHSEPLAELGSGLGADAGVGWRAGWERLVLARFPDICTPCGLSGGLDLVCVSRRDVPGLTYIMVVRCIRGWEVAGVRENLELGVRSVELGSGFCWKDGWGGGVVAGGGRLVLNCDSFDLSDFWDWFGCRPDL